MNSTVAKVRIAQPDVSIHTSRLNLCYSRALNVKNIFAVTAHMTLKISPTTSPPLTESCSMSILAADWTVHQPPCLKKAVREFVHHFKRVLTRCLGHTTLKVRMSGRLWRRPDVLVGNSPSTYFGIRPNHCPITTKRNAAQKTVVAHPIRTTLVQNAITFFEPFPILLHQPRRIFKKYVSISI